MIVQPWRRHDLPHAGSWQATVPSRSPWRIIKRSIAAAEWPRRFGTIGKVETLVPCGEISSDHHWCQRLAELFCPVAYLGGALLVVVHIMLWYPTQHTTFSTNVDSNEYLTYFTYNYN